MQFNVAIILAAIASVAVAQSTVTVTVCPSSMPSSSPAGVASPTVASTGANKPPTPTGSPIAFQGAASVNAVSGSALGMIIAGGVALLL